MDVEAASPSLRTGLMGGSFNPPHLGHINSLLTVRKKFRLDKVYVIPAGHPPGKKAFGKKDSLHRVEMLKRAFQRFPFVQIDDQEIRRRGVSYSFLTVENRAKNNPASELFFILGRDQFERFISWRRPLRILQKACLIVTSRPPNRTKSRTGGVSGFFLI